MSDIEQAIVSFSNHLRICNHGPIFKLDQQLGPIIDYTNILHKESMYWWESNDTSESVEL